MKNYCFFVTLDRKTVMDNLAFCHYSREKLFHRLTKGDTMADRGLLIVFSGPSGVGKGTVRREIFESSENQFSILCIDERHVHNVLEKLDGC